MGGYGKEDGHFWLGCGNRICEVFAGKVKVWEGAHGVPPDRWRSVLVARSGVVYARGDRHFASLAPGSNDFEAVVRGLNTSVLGTRASFMAQDPPSMLAEDPQGRILTNIAGGVARLDDGEWTMLTAKNGIPNGEILSMLFDHAGVLRLGVDSRGVERWLGYNLWEGWSTRSGLAINEVWAIFRDHRKALWVASDLSVQRFAAVPGAPRLEAAPGLRAAQQSQTIAETHDGHLWIGRDNGEVVEYNPVDGVSRTAALVHGVFQVYADQSDRLWIASTHGLFYLDPGARRYLLDQVPSDAVPVGNVYFTAQDAAGVLWFTTEHGIYRYGGSAWSRVKFPGSDDLVFSAELALEPDGSFWVPTQSSGLVHWRMVKGQVEVLDRVDLAKQLSAKLYLVQTDRRGWLWVGTDSGIAVFYGAEWRVFTEDDGLIWNDTDSGAFFPDDDGSVWIGSSGGLAHVLHPEALFASIPLEIRLSDVEVGGKAVTAGIPRFRWGHDTLSFHLAANQLERTDSVKFRYYLHGLDEGWVEARGNDVRYPPLAAGRYELEVDAVDAPRNAEAPPIHMAFEILPPWWQTRTFSAGVVVGLLALCAAGWRWSTRLLLSRKRELEVLVRFRTSELEAEKAALLAARASLVEQATRDFLTGLLNRGAIFSALTRELERAHREQRTFPVILADIDHFKRINDGHGHLAGDQVLREVGRRFNESLRAYDQSGRYGGEEFLMLMPGLAADNSPGRIAELHRMVCTEPIRCGEVSLQITCSFGVAFGTLAGEAAEAVVHAADLALYRAKANGRNRIEYAEAEGERVPIGVVE